MKLFFDMDFSRLNPTAVALGMFDGVHLGHQAVISSAFLEERLEPSVFTFTTHTLKPEKKLHSLTLYIEKAKEKIIEKMGVENYVSPDFITFKDKTAAEFFKEILVEKMNARIICCGVDFQMGSDCAEVDKIQKLADGYGIELKLHPPVVAAGEIVSSTRIRESILTGDIENANRLLGRPFSYDFPVLKGNKIGRIIGYRTLNQEFPEWMIVPKFGVYKSVVIIEGKSYHGLTNIGVKPTVGSSYPISETYVIDWNGTEVYGEMIEVNLISYLRGERKFDSIELLRNQIKEDIKRVMV